jgi:hypothetical protein
MDELTEIQNWYLSNCNGDWEHEYGIAIETLDNPGWSITINLEETELENKVFTEIEHGFAPKEDDVDWYLCKVEDNKFIGRCGPLHLKTVLSIFLYWKSNN